MFFRTFYSELFNLRILPDEFHAVEMYPRRDVENRHKIPALCLMPAFTIRYSLDTKLQLLRMKIKYLRMYVTAG